MSESFVQNLEKISKKFSGPEVESIENPLIRDIAVIAKKKSSEGATNWDDWGLYTDENTWSDYND